MYTCTCMYESVYTHTHNDEDPCHYLGPRGCTYHGGPGLLIHCLDRPNCPGYSKHLRLPTVTRASACKRE